MAWGGGGGGHRPGGGGAGGGACRGQLLATGVSGCIEPLPRCQIGPQIEIQIQIPPTLHLRPHTQPRCWDQGPFGPLASVRPRPFLTTAGCLTHRPATHATPMPQPLPLPQARTLAGHGGISISKSPRLMCPCSTKSLWSEYRHAKAWLHDMPRGRATGAKYSVVRLHVGL